MMNRFVIDTNVIVSGLLFNNSAPFQVIKLAEQQGIILYSEATLEELENVLNRPKFNKYITLEERQVFLLKFISVSELVLIKDKIAVCRDSKDNKFLELAVSGNANLMITGDLDLLVLNPFQGTEIITPDLFIERFPVL
ncbi:putative toxin-antitoxin system toxin component, PIN family [Spirulina sp. CS-785/01]|uniref:putative toxin-antitoxin system toxin component, PIN family n=1 Tax=Spirulina sp. CS-785/01 TaxID=3021716 RepID=UPI00232FFE0E|nr:putative toxin-antitoxin system toxin component, PIN family [Spirulina sp. CS-785/01]MDB9314090.1 putative toxin-antitoxin system toxin component, PIN family [Spirulina sp. CS-785/01]